ncbi:MAG TPA: metallophosphoesterase [Thermoplasmatales archaeon]|nr:metallophosphoesterase [Thermoplasmatales archaeon]
MILQPILDTPALFIYETKTLVISDLHIGIEKELREYGIYVSSKTWMMQQRLIDLCEEWKPEDLFILGDVKHTIPSFSYYEKKEIKNFFEAIKEYTRIHITPGNHDGNLKKLLPNDIIIHPSDGFIFNNIGFLHGHRWPNEKLMNSRYIIFGHTHPFIQLTDRLGLPNMEPCWVKGFFYKDKTNEKYETWNENIEFIIIPTFNPLLGGIAVNKEGIVGPLKNIINLSEAQVYLLDGSSLGSIGNL